MKLVGIIIAAFGLSCIWAARSAMDVGVHATSKLERLLDALVDAAIDSARTPEERKQRFAERAAFKKELEVYALDAGQKAMEAGFTLFALGFTQCIVGAVVVLIGMKPRARSIT